MREQVKEVFAIMDEDKQSRANGTRPARSPDAQDRLASVADPMDQDSLPEEEGISVDETQPLEGERQPDDGPADEGDEDELVSMVVSHSQPTGFLLPHPTPYPTLSAVVKGEEKLDGLKEMQVEVVEILDSDDEADDNDDEDEEDEEMVSDVDSDEEDLRRRASPRIPLHSPSPRSHPW